MSNTRFTYLREFYQSALLLAQLRETLILDITSSVNDCKAGQYTDRFCLNSFCAAFSDLLSLHNVVSRVEQE